MGFIKIFTGDLHLFTLFTWWYSRVHFICWLFLSRLSCFSFFHILWGSRMTLCRSARIGGEECQSVLRGKWGIRVYLKFGRAALKTAQIQFSSIIKFRSGIYLDFAFWNFDWSPCKEVLCWPAVLRLSWRPDMESRIRRSDQVIISNLLTGLASD